MSDQLASFFSGILQPALALVILGMGATIAMKSAPQIAQGVISWGKRVGMGAGKWAGRGVGTALGRKVSPKIEAWGKRLAEQGERPSGSRARILSIACLSFFLPSE